MVSHSDRAPKVAERSGTSFLIVDDHALFRRGLALFISSRYPGCTVIEAASVETALAHARRANPPDIVLMDLVMPGHARTEGVARLIDELPGIPLLVLSAYDDVDDIMACMQLGAKGYVSKAASEMVLENAISLVLEGETYVPSSVLAAIRSPRPVRDADDLANVDSESPLHTLTRRQRQTLALLIEGHANKEIARRLGLLESTVKAHVKIVLKKLDAANRTQAALIALRSGWAPPSDFTDA